MSSVRAGDLPVSNRSNAARSLGLDTDGWFERLVVRRVLLPVTFLLAALAVGVTSGLVEIPPADLLAGRMPG